jgi:hypothetical protein
MINHDFLKGWVIHYNFFRPHLSLNDKTAAQMAGIKFPYTNWKELIEKQPYSVTARMPIKIKEPRLSPKLPRLSPKLPDLSPKMPKELKRRLFGQGRIRL